MGNTGAKHVKFSQIPTLYGIESVMQQRSVSTLTFKVSLHENTEEVSTVPALRSLQF